MKTRFLKLFIAILIASLSDAGAQNNPAAPDFDQANSDQKAIAVADQAMNAMGGRKNWDDTRYVAWNFFGVRKHVWDKWTGDVRIENVRDDQVILMNINTNKGRIFKFGAEQTNADSLTKYLKIGKGVWINDSYWLVMPFKLKDSGVTLKHLGDSQTKDGKEADLLQLTFKNVGNTPDNKYNVWVDKQSHLVWQWAYYPKYEAEKPGFVLPWTNYQQCGNILLSGERGDRDLTDIKVLKKLPGAVFTSFEKVSY